MCNVVKISLNVLRGFLRSFHRGTLVGSRICSCRWFCPCSPQMAQLQIFCLQEQQATSARNHVAHVRLSMQWSEMKTGFPLSITLPKFSCFGCLWRLLQVHTSPYVIGGSRTIQSRSPFGSWLKCVPEGLRTMNLDSLSTDCYTVGNGVMHEVNVPKPISESSPTQTTTTTEQETRQRQRNPYPIVPKW